MDEEQAQKQVTVFWRLYKDDGSAPNGYALPEKADLDPKQVCREFAQKINSY